MKADLSRSTFDAARHFKRVLLQQGRVQTDADANEQQAIVFHRVETEALDLIGGCGGPIHDAGFEITVAGGELIVGAGRYYVDGRLAVCETAVPYLDQPHLPLDASLLAALGLDPDAFRPRTGVYLAYLDVWEWHRTALEVPSLREVALGGPDTATRTQTVWQVRLHDLSGELDPDCVSPIASFDEATAPSTGQLKVELDAAAASPDPCIVTPGAGYRRLENQLYRVEVHTGGVRADTTLKWDRDNGTIVGELLEQSHGDSRWRLSSVGRDAVLRFAPGDWAELTDDSRELHGVPGTLVRVVAVEGDVLTVDLDGPRYPAGASVARADFPLTPRVRRWNGVLERLGAARHALEDGVGVKLRAGTGPDGRPRHYRTGDYWTIPARTTTGAVEWPAGDNGYVSPEGIAHHVCRLGIVTFGDEEDESTRVDDCRRLFPPVTELTALHYVGGDGQSGAPSRDLTHDLVVGVANGSHPVEGARVQFEVVEGGGTVSQTEAPTGGDGLASVVWELGPDGDQRVRATLLDAAGDPVHLPVYFTAEIQPLVLDYVGGDGQSAMPGGPLDHPLRVGVSRNGEPVPDQRVEFRIESGGGRLNGGAGPVTDTTLADGLASVAWELGPDGEQAVVAELLGAGGGIHLPVHFGADLSTADGVAYTPSEGCALPETVATVQDALDELCQREAAACAVTVAPGPGWQSRAQALLDGAQDLHLCFQAGTYVLREPLRIVQKGHVAITGCGPATRFEIASAERVFDAAGCESLRFADFAAEARFAGDANDARPAEHLGGVVTVVGCPSVTVERVALRCAPGVRRAVTGITVRDHHSGAQRGRRIGSTRIRGCDIGVGHQQTGVLVANVERAVIEDNHVYATERPAPRVVSDLLAHDTHYRRMLAEAMVSAPREVQPQEDPRDVPRAVREGFLRAGLADPPVEAFVRLAQMQVAFYTPRELVQHWDALLRAHPLRSGDSEASAVQHLHELRAGVLGGTLGEREAEPFRDWLLATTGSNPAIASQGIVVAHNELRSGSVPAPDVRIRDNRVEGCRQGIHVGASHAESAAENEEDPPDRIDTVLVAGNTVDVSLSPETSRERHGIFVGNAEHVTVQDNRIRVARTDPGAVWRIDGVRLYGHYGAMLLVRQNHVTGASIGVRVEPLGDRDDAQDRHWYVSDNVAPGARPAVLAPGHVLQERNRPL